MIRPPLTPLAALKKLAITTEQRIMEGGEGEWTYYMDGPQNSPQEVWYPIACYKGELTWAPRGEVGDPITEQTTWISAQEQTFNEVKAIAQEDW